MSKFDTINNSTFVNFLDEPADPSSFNIIKKKILILGATKTGKSTLLELFVENKNKGDNQSI